jgi:hypothetical protein
MLILLLKIVLTILLLGMFAYGLIAAQSGRVYVKGRWYGRTENKIEFWSTITLYLLSPPLILYLAWTAS